MSDDDFHVHGVHEPRSGNPRPFAGVRLLLQ